jgi:hypothetical protein
MNANDYLALNFKDITELLPIDTRRDFLKRLGGGIIIFVALGDFLEAQEEGRPRGARPGCPPISTRF